MSHTSVKQVSAWIAGDKPPQQLESVVARLRANADLTAVATAFVALHEQRERADYDHEADFTRPGTWADVQKAARAVHLLQAKHNDDDFRSFLGLIALRLNLRR